MRRQVSASALRDRLTGISPFSARRPEQKYVVLGWFSGCAFWTAPFFKRHLRFAPEPSICAPRRPRSRRP